MFESDKIVVTATTLFGNSALDFRKGALSCAAIKVYRKLGCNVVIVDGGSESVYIDNFSKLGAEIFSQQISGMGNGKREAVRRAFDTEKEIIVLTDLEKLSFAKNLEILLNNMLIGDLLIPKRYDFSGYNQLQVAVEKVGNECWKNLTGEYLDMWFGPRVFLRSSASYFIECEGEKWDAIFKPVIKMIYDQKRICSRVVNYKHDSAQSELESGDFRTLKKRIEQLDNLIIPLREYWERIHA